MNQSNQLTERVIREAECRQLTPARRKLGGRAVGWLLSEVSEWQQSRCKAA
ncbi:AlpA family phage regulatory protein [Citrobacter freundii]|nr:AlpA family phage regulatory protein [Citrobacter freundii]